MKKRMKKRLSDNTFFFRLIWRFTLFLTLFSAVLLSFYLSGNFQQFLDSTQRFILLFCSIACAMLAFFAAVGVFDSIIMFYQNRELKYIRSFFTFLILLALAAAIVLSLRIISSLSLGLQ